MDIIELFYKLMLRFVPISETKILALQDEAKEWYTKIKKNEDASELQKKIVLFLDNWFARTLACIAYIILVKQISDYMSGNSSEEGNDL